MTYFDDSRTITGFLTERRKYERIRKGFNTSLGIEYYLTDNSSLLGNIIYRQSTGENNSTNDVNVFDANNLLLDNRYRTEDEDEDSNTLQYSLN